MKNWTIIYLCIIGFMVGVLLALSVITYNQIVCWDGCIKTEMVNIVGR
jgi:hypothetical protein